MILRTAWREARGARGRLLFFTLSLALGVAALTGVGALVGAIRSALYVQSRELLGADLAVDARQPIPEALDAYLSFGGAARRTDVRELGTVVSAGGRSRLVELKVVGPDFPYYGEIVLDTGEAGAAGNPRLGELLGPTSCVVAPELRSELGLALGSTLELGGQAYVVAAFVTDEPGRLDVGLRLGPRVFLSLEGLARTRLEDFGSRIRYRALYAFERELSRAELGAARRRIEAELPEAPYLRLESHQDAQPTVRRGLDRVESYLGLVALLSLILGGTGVAQIVRAWLASRTQSVAVMRVLGFRPREVLLLYLGHVVLLALAASLAGAIVGSLAPLALPLFASDLLPAGLVLEWHASALLRGTALGVAIASVFSLPPLTAVWRVPPARVLRVEAEPLRAPLAVRLGAFLALGSGVALSAWSQTRELDLALGFTLGVALAAGALALAARALVFLAGRTPRSGLGPYLRHGIAALARPSAGVLGSMVALGLGVLVVSAMVWIERRLAERLAGALPEDAPSVFLVDVQPDQWPALRAELERLGARALRSVPVLTARLAAIDGEEVSTLVRERREGEGRRPGWVLTREQRMTWAERLSPDNRIVAGALWSEPEKLELSLEQRFAEDLGVGLGSVLRFDVQGIPVELTVSSLREVEWESFGINFFLVAEPGALEAAPHWILAAARLEPAAEEGLQQWIAGELPNVTPVRVRAILEKVLAVLRRLAGVVRALGSVTIVTGLAILCGVASSSALERRRETAILKVLGLRRLDVARLLGTEFGLLGLVAGAIGSAAAYLLARIFFERVLELEPELPLWLLPAFALGSGLASAGAGLLAMRRALASRPIESLRA